MATETLQVTQESIAAAIPKFVLQRCGEESLHVGFSGPRIELGQAQHASLDAVLRAIPAVAGAHHGDCVGADAQFHALCLEQAFAVHIHPPTDARNRAFCEGAASVAKELGYLKRNRAIVQAVDLLVAAVRDAREVQRSGIWATVRAARKANKPVILLPPDGVVLLEVA